MLGQSGCQAAHVLTEPQRLVLARLEPVEEPLELRGLGEGLIRQREPVENVGEMATQSQKTHDETIDEQLAAKTSPEKSSRLWHKVGHITGRGGKTKLESSPSQEYEIVLALAHQGVPELLRPNAVSRAPGTPLDYKHQSACAYKITI